MRAGFNVVGSVVVVLVCVVAIFLTLLLVGGGGVMGQIQDTVQEEKSVLLCDNAVQAIVNNPGKGDVGRCPDEYCVATDWEHEGCLGDSKKWQIEECGYRNPDDPEDRGEGCDCRLMNTGIYEKERPPRCLSRVKRWKKVCVTTGGYNTPGLNRKIDIWKVCGYDMTQSNECETGRLEDERSALWFRVGRMLHMACDHGKSLNKVEDFPVFVEVCKFKMAVRDYKKVDIYDPDSRCELEEDATDITYAGLRDRSTFDLSCIDDSTEAGKDTRECYEYLGTYIASYDNVYRYYLCMSGAGNPDDPPCWVGYPPARDAERDAEIKTYRVVYTHGGDEKPSVSIKIASDFDEDTEWREAAFCE